MTLLPPASYIPPKPLKTGAHEVKIPLQNTLVATSNLSDDLEGLDTSYSDYRRIMGKRNQGQVIYSTGRKKSELYSDYRRIMGKRTSDMLKRETVKDYADYRRIMGKRSAEG